MRLVRPGRPGRQGCGVHRRCTPDSRLWPHRLPAGQLRNTVRLSAYTGVCASGRLSAKLLCWLRLAQAQPLLQRFSCTFATSRRRLSHRLHIPDMTPIRSTSVAAIHTFDPKRQTREIVSSPGVATSSTRPHNHSISPLPPWMPHYTTSPPSPWFVQPDHEPLDLTRA